MRKMCSAHARNQMRDQFMTLYDSGGLKHSLDADIAQCKMV